MAKITYNDKVSINENADIPAINKCQASDMNEIKQVVNENDDKIGELQPNIITAELVKQISVTPQSGTINLTDAVIVGNKLSFANGKVIIGAGVSKVKISGNMRVSSSGSSLGVNLNIFKNNDIYAASNRTGVGADGYDGIAVSPKLIEVLEGDTIDMRYWKSSSTQSMTILGNTYGSTYLTVEVVE